MGTFKEHIQQSQNNLYFLSKINTNINESWDWQVTVCFYTALHLINSHIVNKAGANYLSHSKVEEIINPYNNFSLAKLDEKIFTSYIKLFQLSRRSRYLLSENFKKGEKTEILPASLTYSKHFKKAVHHLDVIITFINKEYNEPFPKVDIKCIDLKGQEFNNFNVTI